MSSVLHASQIIEKCPGFIAHHDIVTYLDLSLLTSCATSPHAEQTRVCTKNGSKRTLAHCKAPHAPPGKLLSLPCKHLGCNNVSYRLESTSSFTSESLKTNRKLGMQIPELAAAAVTAGDSLFSALTRCTAWVLGNVLTGGMVEFLDYQGRATMGAAWDRMKQMTARAPAADDDGSGARPRMLGDPRTREEMEAADAEAAPLVATIVALCAAVCSGSTVWFEMHATCNAALTCHRVWRFGRVQASVNYKRTNGVITSI